MRYGSDEIIWWDEKPVAMRERVWHETCARCMLCMIVMWCMMIGMLYVCVHSKLNTRHLTILLTEHMSACSPSHFKPFSGASRGKTPIGWSFRSFQLCYCILRWVLSRSRPTLYLLFLCPNVRRSAADYIICVDGILGRQTCIHFDVNERTRMLMHGILDYVFVLWKLKWNYTLR